jgi:deoxyribose-phosphate aldolase
MEMNEMVSKIADEVLLRIKGGGSAAPAQTSANGGADVVGAIEHSVMNPDTTDEDIRKACAAAREYRFANVCVMPYHVPLAVELLRGSGIPVCTTVAFPHGAWPAATKQREARDAIHNGAEELDVAINIPAVKSGKYDEAYADLKAIVELAQGKARVKAIYEQGLYSDEEKVKVLEMACRAGADFVKIQNFLSGKKAVPEDAAFVRSIVGKAMGIKIDGGVSDADTMRKLMAAGATRVGASKSVKIARGE